MTQEQKQNQALEPKPETIKATADIFFDVGSDVRREPFDFPYKGKIARFWVHSIGGLDFNQVQRESTEKDQLLRCPACGFVTPDDLYNNARFIQRCVRDDSGQPVFKLTDITRLVTTRMDLYYALLRVCNRVNGLGKEGEEAIEKNLKPTVTSGSSSGQPVGTA